MIQIKYESSQCCEFTILGMIDQWEQPSKFIGKSALEICEENNLPITVFWEFYRDYKAIKRNR